MLSFVYRPSREDVSEDGDVSRQLHSSVRTSNLETSLRLLSQGADPNYYHKVKLDLVSYIQSSICAYKYIHYEYTLTMFKGTYKITVLAHVDVHILNQTYSYGYIGSLQLVKWLQFVK